MDSYGKPLSLIYFYFNDNNCLQKFRFLIPVFLINAAGLVQN